MQSASEAINSFKKHFSGDCRIFFAPGRINLIGEHIDYNDGFVLPAAINKGIWFAIAPNNTHTANFVAVDINETLSISLTEVKNIEGWQSYVLGVLHILQKEGFALNGFNCVFGGNVPQGAGLSSSAALEAGLLYCLNELFQLHISHLDMALLAQKAEHVYPGTKCGIMDMFASLHGKKDHCILLDCRSLTFNYFPIVLEQYDWVLINSKVKHSLNDGAYNKRREVALDALSLFQSINQKITSYRNILPSVVTQFKYALNEEEFKRSLYITQEIERVQAAGKHLEEGNLVAFGKLMFQTHDGLSNLYEVSCPELDYLVTQAKFHQAVIGARLMGGGFGGCTINLIEKESREAVLTDITTSYQNKFGIIPEVYVVESSDGVHELLNLQ
ncbi:galactokinase [Parasediminibacterium paludis]|uniref:Galactokinase n=1 Tax=Parasediminibacterium paludis TaxID=908966 RepID=A0ABV8PYP9_9BACT